MKSPKLLALCGLALGLPALAACSIFNGASRDSDGQITEAGDVDAFQLAVGDCLILADLADTITSVPAKPCSEAHDGEVIKLITVQSISDGVYDEAVVTEEAETGCEAAMGEVVGPNWVETGLSWTYLYPTDESWETGDREIVCMAAVEGLTLTATVAGTGN
ncbi:MAG: septum formation family protein [Propionibacteriaceae bacterium]|nr:septum formation family protein [Propionibacteriaceae bacterium]